VLQYPKGNESCASYGNIKDINEHEIEIHVQQTSAVQVVRLYY